MDIRTTFHHRCEHSRVLRRTMYRRDVTAAVNVDTCFGVKLDTGRDQEYRQIMVAMVNRTYQNLVYARLDICRM